MTNDLSVFTFGVFNFHLVKVGGIQSFLTHFHAMKMCGKMLNATNIYLKVAMSSRATFLE